jgi:hypothetical protein
MTFKCGFCKKSFKKESTLAVHVCEKKRRHMVRDNKDAQLGFRTYQLFYKVGTNSKKEKTYEDFADSHYYTAFIKFATYCIDLKIDNVENYTTWLIRNQTRLDKWASDTVFNNYIKDRLKTESVSRAVERTVLFLNGWASENNTNYDNYFTMVNTNIAVVHICSGKISPWVLYASKGAQELLNRMNDEQIRIISEYVDPHFWSIRIKRKVEDFVWVESVMKEAQL